MAEFESLKIKLCSNNCTVKDLLKFDLFLKKELLKPSVSNDLPKLLAGVFNYSLHEDVKYRNASVSSLKSLVDLLDLNKHLKTKSWWPEMKQDIVERLENLAKLITSGDENGPVVWCEVVKMLGTDLKTENVLLNKLLKMAESLFKANENLRVKAFQCWNTLIDNFSIHKLDMVNKKRLNLLVTPLKARNHTSKELCAAKFETWKHLLTKINQHNDITVELVVSNFLQFMFESIGSLPPVCTVLDSECAEVFLQLLKTGNLFHLGQLPELMIEHSLICIGQIHTKDPSLSLKVWEALLGNLSHEQWSEKHVAKLINYLSKAGQNEGFARSKVYAEMIHCLYSVPYPMPAGVLMQNCDLLLLLMLEPHTLINFTETWCSEWFDVMSKSDLMLLPQNALSDIIRKLPALAASGLFREGKLKLLRSIWMEVTNIFCKFISDNAQMGNNFDNEKEMNNAIILLSFGAAELSSMWNKLQMKSWKVLYSETVKFCSLMPEADKFASDLIDSLQKELRLAKMPLHVAVDLASIILEVHLSKDTTSILPLLLEISEKGISSILNDINGTSAVMNNFLKTIVAAARNETALVNDVLLVIGRFLDELPLSEKLRSLAFKAQHQLQPLKPGRVQDKSISPGGTSVQQTSSPTMTSFMHRMSKKQSSSSPTTSHSSDRSSPLRHTPNSKKAFSPFIDDKSEDFVFVPPKTRRTVLTDHQKEALTTRKHDIPALYQDLSQDSSQSAIESIVTSVKTLEGDLSKIHVLSSPKKENHTLKLGLKVVTPKKGSNTSIDETKHNLIDARKNQAIATKHTWASSLLDKNEQHSAKNIIQISPLKSNSQNKNQNENSLKNSNKKITKSIECLGLRKSPTEAEDTPVQVHTVSLDTSLKEESKMSEPPTLSPSHLSQPMVTLFGKYSSTWPKLCPLINASNYNEMDNGNKMSKSHEVITLDTSGSESENDKFEKISNNKNTKKSKLKIRKTLSSHKKHTNKDVSQLSPNLNIESPKNGTPKISPRRLRKRKSGLTPILGVESSKKKRLSHILTTTNCTTTVKSIVPIIQGFSKDDKQDKVVNLTDSPLENCSMENIKCVDTPSDKVIISEETSPAKLSKIRDNLKEHPKTIVCSPVKVILERVQIDQKNSAFESDILLNDQNSNTSLISNKLNMLEKESKNNRMMQQKEMIEIQITEQVPVDSTKEDVKENKIKDKCHMKDSESSFDLKKRSPNHKLPVYETTTFVSPSKSYTTQSPTKKTQMITKNSQIDYTNQEDVTSHECTNPIVLKPVETKTKTNKKTVAHNKKTISSSLTEKDIEIKLIPVETNESSSFISKTDSTKDNNTLRQENQSKSGEKVVCGDKEEIASVDCSVTPVKQGQKNFKQTQLPFTPVSKCPDSKLEEKQCSLSTSPKKSAHLNLSLGDKKGEVPKKSPYIILDKLNCSKISNDMVDELIKSPSALQKQSISISSHNSKNTTIEAASSVKDGKSSSSTKQEASSTQLESNKQVVVRTPEKISAIQSSCSKSTTLATEIPASGDSTIDSPVKPTESEDVIASSQEIVLRPTSVSFRITGNNSGLSSPPRLFNKSPKKIQHLSDNHNNNVSDRKLRSSPVKTDSQRLSSTPIKKSVCRRLDVEIEDDVIEESKLVPLGHESGKVFVNNLEMSNEDILQNENQLQKKQKPPDESNCGSNTEEDETLKDDTKLTNTNTSPTGQKGQQGFLKESNSSQTESPKRFLGSLRLENAGSPKSSSSRTNQMMELAMQDKEKTISSPNSIKKRRIVPIKLGPTTKMQKIQSPTVALRTHNGLSEEWVRRTYSPTASPNSSILKRKIDVPLDSPDSSPLSSKKKRVSFLDPPVSESLLFSKADPGKGQVQRIESKKENESEEVPTQGSVQLELSPEKYNSEVNIFSPLKECEHPITDILERIGSDQWLSELESSLKRLGVTSIGHLCSLSEATVQRLPFRTPNIGTLRKILQNYYNEICERIATNIQDSEHTDNPVEESAAKSDVNDLVEVLPQQKECKDETSMSVDHAVDVTAMAEQMKKSLEQYPDLIPALGNTLNIRVIFDILKCAIDKLPSHVDSSS